MNTSRFAATFLVLLASAVMLYGRSASTGWSALNLFIGNAYEEYAKANDGKLPSSWDDLEPYWNSLTVESATGLKIRENTHVFDSTATLPHVDYTGKLLVMSANVIIEGRRPEKGRYVVYRTGDGVSSGSIDTKWLAESVIQAAARKAGVPAPSTGDYHDTSVIAAWKHELIPALGAVLPPPDPNAPYKFPDTPPKLNYGINGEPLSMPVQPVQGTTVLGPTATFDISHYGYVTAAACALLALVGLGIRAYNDRHRPTR